MAAVKDYQNFTQKGFGGACDEISEERAVLELTAKEPRCIVHFMVPEFRRCAIMNMHLDKLAAQHFKTRFVKFNAQNGQWLCAKLNVRELPAVLCFVGGKNVDRVVGMEELGRTDEFSTQTLERRLGKSGVIFVDGAAAVATSTKLFGYASRRNDDSDDSDED